MSVFVPLTKIPNFDPQTVPIKSWDAHLPALPASEFTIVALQNRFTNPPAWQPEVREEPRFTDRRPREAAVLIAIVMHLESAGGPAVLLTLRSDALSTHSGQIAFAGGKLDEGETAHEAALREAHEEIGLPASYVQVLGNLPRYTTGTAFHITPVVAAVQPGFKLQANPAEVAEVFEVPLSFLMNPANHARHAFEFEGHHREWFSMPWQDEEAGKERFIWGATAGMLRNLYRFLSV